MKKKISKEKIIDVIAKKLKMSSAQVEKIDNFKKMSKWTFIIQNIY